MRVDVSVYVSRALLCLKDNPQCLHIVFEDLAATIVRKSVRVMFGKQRKDGV